MPYKTDKSALKDPFLDKRVKLLPCQKEMVSYWYKVMGVSITQISKVFKVNKRVIQFTLFPERLEKNRQLRFERGGSKIYYDKDYHNEKMNIHRRRKHSILKDIENLSN